MPGPSALTQSEGHSRADQKRARRARASLLPVPTGVLLLPRAVLPVPRVLTRQGARSKIGVTCGNDGRCEHTAQAGIRLHLIVTRGNRIRERPLTLIGLTNLLSIHPGLTAFLGFLDHAAG